MYVSFKKKKLLDKCVTAKEEMEKDLFEKVCDECSDY